MEVWALEAYGVAFILRELLTIKSDDTYGRNKAYEAIVKGNLYYQTGIPESFKVLINEIRSLCIDLELIGEDTADDVMDDIFINNTNDSLGESDNESVEEAEVGTKTAEVETKTAEVETAR